MVPFKQPRSLVWTLRKGAQSNTLAAQDSRAFLGEIVTDELGFCGAMQLLRSFSMIEPIETGGSYDVHPAVHQWAYHQQSVDMREQCSYLAMNILGCAVPDRFERDSASIFHRLLPHADVFDRLTTGVTTSMHTSIAQLERLGTGRLDRTVDLLSATCLVGNLYAFEGSFKRAEHIYSEVLQEQEKLLGRDDEHILVTTRSLGAIYIEQGRLIEAERMLLRARNAYKRSCKRGDDLDVGINNLLVLLYAKLSRFSEAERICKEALLGREQLLAGNHPLSLETVLAQGNLYLIKNKPAQAESMMERALEGYRAALGPLHPYTLRSILGLVFVYVTQSKLTEAEQMARQAKRGFEEVLGATHPTTLGACVAVALSILDRGELDEAETLYMQVLNSYEAAGGAQQVGVLPPILPAWEHFGWLRQAQGRDDEARQLYRDAMSGLAAVYGPSSSDCKRMQKLLSYLDSRSKASFGRGIAIPDKEIATTIAWIEQKRREGRIDDHFDLTASYSYEYEGKPNIFSRLRRRLQYGYN